MSPPSWMVFRRTFGGKLICSFDLEGLGRISLRERKTLNGKEVPKSKRTPNGNQTLQEAVFNLPPEGK